MSLLRRHVPDLQALQRVCETNYMGLMKLLPRQWQTGDSHQFAAADGLHYRLTLLETAPYTALVEITQRNEHFPEYLRAHMRVRLYHDARMAEVCVSQQICRLQPSYDYPNAQMHQRDEKEQCNHFLADWLRFCLAHGYGTLTLPCAG